MKFCSCVLILNSNNQILSVSRKDNHDDWGLPGGKLDDNESFIEAAIRETFEETGYNIKIIDEFNYFESKDSDFLVRTYRAKILDECPKPISVKETGLVAYKNISELLVNSFSEYNLNCFRYFNL